MDMPGNPTWGVAWNLSVERDTPDQWTYPRRVPQEDEGFLFVGVLAAVSVLQQRPDTGRPFRRVCLIEVYWCMERLGVIFVTGSLLSPGWFVAFHPFKDVERLGGMGSDLRIWSLTWSLTEGHFPCKWVRGKQTSRPSRQKTARCCSC